MPVWPVWPGMIWAMVVACDVVPQISMLSVVVSASDWAEVLLVLE